MRQGKMLLKMTNKQYHKARAVSRSVLHAMRDVPAGSLYPYKPTGSANLGTAAHTYVLEPHLYDDLVIESVNKASTGKDFKEMTERFPDKCVLLSGGKEKVELLGNAVWKHPKAAEILGLHDMIPEPSFFWKDKDTGIWCKTRPDIYCPEAGIMGDLKFLSKGKADPRKFTWACRDFGYGLQAAWNIWGVKQVTGAIISTFWFIIVETEEPYRIACYQLDEDWLGEELYEAKRLLSVEHECRKNEDWPNYSTDNIDGETIYRGI